MPRTEGGATPKGTHRRHETGGCQLSEIFAVLGQPHMLRLLHEFQESGGAPLRFTTLQLRLRIPPKTLSARLRALVDAGFVSRHAYREIPPRVEYVSTLKTAELAELFSAIGQWAASHTLSTVPETTTVGRASA